ncbi:MAG: GGDEF domain-containing protein [Eubacteriales bacterium]|nr:GGDEF domain-containing protein [Eubacteriales bacterium]
MPSAIFIEIIGVIALMFVFFLANKKILVEVKTHKIIKTSIITVLLFCSEISVILLNEKPADLIANALRIMLSSILPIMLSCLINDSLYQYRKYLYIPAYFQFAACIFYVWYEWSVLFIIINVFIQIYSLFLILYACYHASKNNDTQQKLFLLAISFLVIAGYMIENLSENIISGTFISIFLLLYYIFLQEEQMYIDPLTGIQNRWAFDKKMTEMQKEDNVAIIVLDLNNLKTINDTRGHLAGDSCLADVAQVIKISFADTGMPYRIGGDEFCVLCYKADKEKLKADFYKLESLTADLKNSRSLSIEIAYGYDVFKKSKYGNIYDSFTKADLAMYAHKATMKQ